MLIMDFEYAIQFNNSILTMTKLKGQRMLEVAPNQILKFNNKVKSEENILAGGTPFNVSTRRVY